jgi:predicted GNAT family acetyltransferase
MGNSLGEIKKNVSDIKESIRGIKEDVQSTVLGAKEAMNETKDTIARWKSADGADEIGELIKEENAFVLRGRDGQIGEITYAELGGSTWIINHTYVSPPYRGRGQARRMLRRLADEARAENKKLVPICSFAAAQFKMELEYDDVWERNEM